MNRRQLLKLGAAVAVSPSLPVKAAPAIPANWVRFRVKDWGNYSNRLGTVAITRESVERAILQITARYWRYDDP